MHLNHSSDVGIESSNGAKRVKTPRKRSTIEGWLFPSHEDLANSGDEDDFPRLTGRRWVDANLNEEQKVSSARSKHTPRVALTHSSFQNAVQSILWARHRAPLLISGPPGTGKTKTLVESVFQILRGEDCVIFLLPTRNVPAHVPTLRRIPGCARPRLWSFQPIHRHARAPTALIDAVATAAAESSDATIQRSPRRTSPVLPCRRGGIWGPRRRDAALEASHLHDRPRLFHPPLFPPDQLEPRIARNASLVETRARSTSGPRAAPLQLSLDRRSGTSDRSRSPPGPRRSSHGTAQFVFLRSCHHLWGLEPAVTPHCLAGGEGPRPRRVPARATPATPAL